MKTIGVLALGAIVLVIAALMPPPPAEADTVELLSGSNGVGGPGALCDPDPLVTYTSNCAPVTPQEAIVGRGFRDHLCEESSDNLGSTASREVTSSCGNDTWINFETTFELPENFASPVLDLEFKVDDVGRVFLNGHQLAEVCYQHPDVVYALQENNPAFFQGGTNTLAFHVVNSPWSCTFSPVGRGGPYDAMNVEFEGTVTYSTPTLEAVGGIVDLQSGTPDLSAHQSDDADPPYIALAAAIAAAVVAFTAGAWYARRRWLG